MSVIGGFSIPLATMYSKVLWEKLVLQSGKSVGAVSSRIYDRETGSCGCGKWRVMTLWFLCCLDRIGFGAVFILNTKQNSRECLKYTNKHLLLFCFTESPIPTTK